MGVFEIPGKGDAIQAYSILPYLLQGNIAVFFLGVGVALVF